ncbi:MAG: hypothetical protein H6732_06745 [Alphaproteobacteria bacterium]|nr:hypothetical protein [Alphaproteobacteria bacterium]
MNRVWRSYQETGLLYPPVLRGRPPFTLDADDLEVLRGLVNDVPDATLDALTDDVVQITGKPVSRSTVGRALRRTGLTRR